MTEIKLSRVVQVLEPVEFTDQQLKRLREQIRRANRKAERRRFFTPLENLRREGDLALEAIRSGIAVMDSAAILEYVDARY